jgi:hypothetical protein
VGLDGLVFDLPDPEGLSAQARAAGFAASAPQPLSRPAEGGEARFTTVRLARGSLAGGRVYFCRHLTPERVWQPHWQTHPNGACAIDRFWIAVPDPAAEAGRYARLVGARLLPGGPEKAFAAGGCVVELTTPEALQARFGALACDPRDLSGAPRSAYMAALGIRTRSMAALRACLARAGLHARAEGESLIVAARDAMNVTLVFRPLEPAASPQRALSEPIADQSMRS